MRVRITFECEVPPGTEAFIKKLINYNFAHTESIEIEEVADAKNAFIPITAVATYTVANRRNT